LILLYSLRQPIGLVEYILADLAGVFWQPVFFIFLMRQYYQTLLRDSDDAARTTAAG